MPSDHMAYQLAMRAKLMTLTVLTTGTRSLGATATGGVSGASAFTRSVEVDGNGNPVDFVTNGFAKGMEFTPSGFPKNGTTPQVVTAVSPQLLTVSGTLVNESAQAGRSLTVGLPSDRAWENTKFEATIGKPYVEEQYIPGPESLESLAPQGDVTAEPMYNLKIYVPEHVGIGADGRYADAIKRLFAPSVQLPLSSGDDLFVRADIAPFRGQRTRAVEGFSCIPITIPFMCFTNNV